MHCGGTLECLSYVCSLWCTIIKPKCTLQTVTTIAWWKLYQGIRYRIVFGKQMWSTTVQVSLYIIFYYFAVMIWSEWICFDLCQLAKASFHKTNLCHLSLQTIFLFPLEIPDDFLGIDILLHACFSLTPTKIITTCGFDIDWPYILI